VPTHAVELGDVRVESTLGQPLRVSIPFALNADEQMYDFCIHLRQSAGDAAIPAVTRANVSVSGNRIVIMGETVIRDPLLNLQIAVDCPYTPQIARQYTLVVDPVEFADSAGLRADAPAPVDNPATTVSAVQPDVVTPATLRQPAAQEQVSTTAAVAAPAATAIDRSPISMNAEYRVQPGDSASTIVSRIDGRPNTMRDAISVLVAGNPDAFADGDAARLLSGSLLWVPEMTAGAAVAQDPVAPAIPGLREYAPTVSAGTEPTVDVAAESQATVAEREPVNEPAIAETTTEFVEPAIEPVAEVSETVATDSMTDAALPASEARSLDTTDVTVTASDAPVFGTTVPREEPIGPVAESPATGTKLPDSGQQPAAGGIATQGLTELESAELQPGDVVIPAMNSTRDSTATVPTVAPVADAGASGSGHIWSWLTWPIGGALLLVGGVLLLGRRIRGAFASIAIGAPDKAGADPGTLQAVQDSVQDMPEPVMEAPAPFIEAPEPFAHAPEPSLTGTSSETATSIVDDVDFEFTDTIASDSISLDADLDAGTGLQDGSDLDVAEDFGFSASGQVENDIDHEIPEEAAREPLPSPTDVIPPVQREDVASILEEEVVPESDDYDMSMIVDATKQSIDDTELTAQDLQAVPVDAADSDEYLISDDTMTSEADLAALEQDYEEEYTQTQALSKEIAEAAAELAAKLDDDIDDDDPTIDEPALTIEDPWLDPTAEMPSHSVADDATAQMPAGIHTQDLTAEMPTEIANMDETAEMQIDDITVKLAAGSGAENDDTADDEVTAKLAVAASEPTVEMRLDSTDEDNSD